MSKTIVANWKANPSTLGEAQELFDFYLTEIKKYENIELIVCPPFVYLEELAKKLRVILRLNLKIGVQDIFWENSGPFTGEISPDMLKEFNITHVLIGHSDRRYKLSESDEVINKKIKAALDANIVPILLVGERNRDDDRRQVIETQLTTDLADLTANQINKVLITYEPVWAISTNPDSQPDTPENTLGAIELIKNILSSKFQVPSSKFLYGGSVNQSNVADFLKHPEISGAVIGGASLRKEEFSNILKVVSRS